MTTTVDTLSADDVRRWSAQPITALDLLPLPSSWLLFLMVVIVAAEQGLEYYLGPTSGNVRRDVIRASVFPILCVYVPVSLGSLKRMAVRLLAELRPSVLVSDEEYDDRVCRIICANWLVELALLAVSTAILLGLLFGLQAHLLTRGAPLPASLPLAGFISTVYVLLGWLLFSQFYASIRLATGLAPLARCPLVINVFDPANLLPFGWLSLLHILASIGVILIPLVLLGRPSRAGFLVVFVSLTSCVALFVPLWGVHQQIDEAKERVLASIHGQLMEVQETLLQGAGLETDDLACLADRTAMLVHLRAMIERSTSWPFRDTAAVVRAIVYATSPLVYFVLSEFIRLLLFSGTPSSGSP